MESYIKECLSSAINQTLQEIEIICIDDGSTDSSVEIINSFIEKDDRIILIKKENGGLASARNAGINAARGEYIYFLDSDDYIMDSAIETLYMISHKETLDNLYFDAESFFETEELQEKHANFINYYVRNHSYHEITSGLELVKKMDEHNEFRVSACLQFLRKDFLEKYHIRFTEGFFHEDELFTLEIALFAKRVRHINQILYMRRIRENSIMTGNDYFKHSFGYFNCMTRMFNKLLNVQLDRGYRNAIMKRLYGLQYNAFTHAMHISNSDLDRYLEDVSVEEEVLYRLLVKRYSDNTQKLNSLNTENTTLTKRLENYVNRIDSLCIENKMLVKSLDTNTKKLNSLITENKKLSKQIFNSQKQISSLKEEVLSLQRSWSYRVGRVIIFLPGKIKLLFNTIKSCGLRYTFSAMGRKINKRKICISIVIPVYNVEKYLEQCLDSIQKQSLKNIEVICVDDGSTDHSLQILQEFAKMDKRFKLIHKDNTGAGDSRNIGMKYAKGEYLLFLDADDIFYNNLCFDAYKKAKIDDADICFMGAERINMRTNKTEYMGWVLRSCLLPEKTPFQKEEIGDQYFQMVTGCPWSKLFKRTFIMKHQIKFQNLKNSNDIFFVRTAMALANRLTYVDKILITYRFAEGNNTQSIKHKNPLEFYKAYQALKEKLIEENLYESLEKSFVNMTLDDFMFNYRTTNSAEAKKAIVDKLKNEGIDFFDFNKYSWEFYNNKENVKEFQEILRNEF